MKVENEFRCARRTACGAMAWHYRIVLGSPFGVPPQIDLPLLVLLAFCGVNMHGSVHLMAMTQTTTDDETGDYSHSYTPDDLRAYTPRHTVMLTVA